jgi:hypothetical protein
LREEARLLRAEYNFVSSEYQARKITRAEEALLLADITRQMLAVYRQMRRVVPVLSNSHPPIS